MESILTQIFFENLISLPLSIALKKIEENEDLTIKTKEIVFIDNMNKNYFESQNGYNEELLRVVNIVVDQKIKIFVAYEITELIEKKVKRDVKN